MERLRLGGHGRRCLATEGEANDSGDNAQQ